MESALAGTSTFLLQAGPVRRPVVGPQVASRIGRGDGPVECREGVLSAGRGTGHEREDGSGVCPEWSTWQIKAADEAHQLRPLRLRCVPTRLQSGVQAVASVSGAAGPAAVRLFGRLPACQPQAPAAVPMARPVTQMIQLGTVP